MTPFRLHNPFHARKPEPVPVATIRNPEQVLDDIRALLMAAGEFIASGRVKEGKEMIDELIRILGRDGAR